MTLEAYQDAFAAYIRNPQENPIPAGTKPARMVVYRELFFNNVAGFLTANFPILHQLMDELAWQRVVQDFFAQHVCQTPHFSEIAEEFLHYLQHERDCADDFPFMVELAHYEWVEMALSIAQGSLPSSGSVDHVLSAPLSLSSLACVLAYQFPVHRISPQFLPMTTPEHATFLVVYRDVHEEVQFLEITPLTYQLLLGMQEAPAQCAHVYFGQLSSLFPAMDEAVLNQHGEAILRDFVARGVVTCARCD